MLLDEMDTKNQLFWNTKRLRGMPYHLRSAQIRIPADPAATFHGHVQSRFGGGKQRFCGLDAVLPI